MRALWRAWREFWDTIAAKKAETGATVYVVCNGDLGDVNTHDNTQLISNYEPDILLAMADVAQPMLAVADTTFVIRGTAAHTGGNGKLEELFAADIGAERCPDEKSASWWILRAEFGGVRFDITHHPPTSSYRPWTRNAAVARAAGIVAGRYLRGDLPRERPKFAVFSHVHYCGHGAELGVQGRFVPPFKLVGAFGHRKGSGAHVEPVGGWWCLCEDGRVLEEPRDDGLGPFELWKMKRPTIWRGS